MILRLLSRALFLLVLGGSSLSAQVAGFPWVERFDGVTAPALPAGWWSSDARAAGTPDFTVSAGSARSVPNAALSTNATIAQFLVSPLLSFSSAAPDSLRFALRRSSSHIAGIVVEASLDGGATFSLRLGDTLWNNGTTSYVFVTHRLPETLAGCPSVRFRWRIIPAPTGASGTVRLDDVEVAARPACDMALTRLATVPAHPREEEPLSAVLTIRNRGILTVASSAVSCAWLTDADTLPAASGRLGPIPPGDSAVTIIPLGNASPDHTGLLANIVAESDECHGNDTLALAFRTSLREGSVVINEIMYAPVETASEWIELYNTRETAVEIGGWSVMDASGVKHSVASPCIIAARAYLVLTGDAGGLAGFLLPPSTVVEVTGFPSLNNSGDGVVVHDAAGARMDSLHYDSSWGATAGRSLERIDADSPPTERSNWSESADSAGCTPGRRNSAARLPDDLALLALAAVPNGSRLSVPIACTVANVGRNDCQDFAVFLESLASSGSSAPPLAVDSARISLVLRARDSVPVLLRWSAPRSGLSVLRARVETPHDERPANDVRCCTVAVPFPSRALAINEIMAAPLPGDAEYCELVNAGVDAVDITGWSLSDRPTGNGNVNRWSIGDTGRVIPGGQYLVVASDSSLLKRYPGLAAQQPERLTILNVQSLGLNNEGDDLVLRDATDAVIDSVAFLPSWHSPALVDETGHALERIAPQMPSQDRRSWSSCVAPAWGTPGQQNSIYARHIPSGSRLACAPSPFSPDGDGKDDLTIVHYELPLQEALLTVSLYDITGHRIRRLVNAEPAGPSGDVPWDGRTDTFVCARIGVYIVVLEAVDPVSGGTITAKAIVVLAGRL